MLVFACVSNEQELQCLKTWNQSGVLCETQKFPKQGFCDSIFDKWLPKATFWQQVFYLFLTLFFVCIVSSIQLGMKTRPCFNFYFFHAF
jgi:hypothetical protein